MIIMKKQIVYLFVGLLLLVMVGCRAAVPEEAATVESPTAASEVASPTAAVEATATTAEPTSEATVAPEPTAEPTIAPTTPTPTAEPVAAGFCPDVPRPALLLFVPGEKYVLTNPLADVSCDLDFPEPLPGLLQAAGVAPNESLFYYAAEGENQLVVHQLNSDGSVAPLPFTAIDTTQRGLSYGFVVSDDGSKIAWASSGLDPADQQTVVSDLWVADVASGETTTLLSTSQSADEQGLNRGLMPMRFSDDNRALVYAVQPFGIGGSWNSFVGNYDNLHIISTSGGEPTAVFDCAAEGLFLCVGDFTMFGSELTGIVYVDPEAQAVIAENAEGQTLNTFNVSDEYVGYPTFSPGGELVFYSADLSETSITPDAATLYLAAPIIAPSEVVATDPQMMPPRVEMFLDMSHVVVGYTDEAGMFGQAIVNIHEQTLTPLVQWPAAIATAVLREPPPPPQPLQVFADGVEFLVAPSLARDVRYELVPQVTEADVGGFIFQAWPEHRMLTFIQPYADPATLYRQAVNLYPEPRVFFFPVAEYMEINRIAAEQIPQLEALLADQPAEVDGPLPYLPPPNGAQVFHAQEAYLTFEGGKGIRYLTIFNQEPRAINNAELFYTFQGLTDDGRYYISASFPVAAPNLPETGEVEDMDAFAANMEQYVADTTAEMNELNAADFTPNLTVLDAVVESIRFTAE